MGGLTHDLQAPHGRKAVHAWPGQLTPSWFDAGCVRAKPLKAPPCPDPRAWAVCNPDREDGRRRQIRAVSAGCRGANLHSAGPVGGGHQAGLTFSF